VDTSASIDKPIVETSSAAAVVVPPPPLPPAAPPSASPPASTSATPTLGDQNERQIRDLLQRYRLAYEALSASSAREVWPSVNEAALARAFDGLAAQTLVFHDCRIQVRGASATAACRGTASYVPKIGSRYERVEPRNWAFTLRRRGADWEIETASARRQ
jgi:hypothetical protein